MEWTYQITTNAQPMVLARLVQIFDQQRLTISSLWLTQNEEKVDIRLTVEVEVELARRLEAKLWHQVHVQKVRLENASDGEGP